MSVDLSLDYETYSEVDIRKVGLRAYIHHPSTKILLAAYAFGDGPVEQWSPAEGEKIPRDLKEALRDPGVTKRAWNAAFEIETTKRFIDPGTTPIEWRCTMVRAFTLSLPGSLGAAGRVVELPFDKQKDADGKRLLRKFSQPRKPSKTKPWRRSNWITDPEDWQKFKVYNTQDVEAERAIQKRTRTWDLPEHEWDMWFLDQEINERGVPVNPDTIKAAIRYLEWSRKSRLDEMANITGINNPRSNPQLLAWLQSNGYRFDDLKKGHIDKAVNDTSLPKRTRRVCELRSEVAKTSLDKYYAMERSMSDDNTIKGAFQFAGAGRTWRWSGRLVQFQNLPRPSPEFEKCQEDIVDHLTRLPPRILDLLYAKPMDLLASALRPTVQAPKGRLVISADLNAIENRVLGWLADDPKILSVFENDRCPYVDFATYMFGESYQKLEAEWKAGDKSKRTIAKPGVLGCGYLLSAGEQRENEKTGEMEASGLLGYAWSMGIRDFTPEQAKLSVEVWRKTFTKAVEFWWDIDWAARECLRTGHETFAGPVGFDRSGPFMRMILPSGRCLHYCRPRLKQAKIYFCMKKKKFQPLNLCEKPDMEKFRYKEQMTYEGVDDRNQWGRINTHPGKLTENADQAIARDVLAHGAKLAEKEGIRIRLHVHDELVAVVSEKKAEDLLKVLVACMSEKPSWAKRLPLAAAGSISRVWIKD